MFFSRRSALHGANVRCGGLGKKALDLAHSVSEWDFWKEQEGLPWQEVAAWCDMNSRRSGRYVVHQQATWNGRRVSPMHLNVLVVLHIR